ncbi:hypothetical protein [Mycobacterium gastri]|uniref:Uncharacterized protein n=1 Tax=Mycobacterium gastri TaxID=1777 RepID=A0A1X1VXG6_MYCGS|nr:hypothetical protein [Mycobacterium gastri]ETW23000.1 hypothetical protein MGAST_16645 [Mycobacterium gastri 'Wayne']ORV74263.1 hypothetical protein AWC07_25530 [Mycobacterium gastri]
MENSRLDGDVEVGRYGNVDTMLHALRYDIAVQRVQAPTVNSPDVAIGSTAGGVEGFRRTHREASEAHRVAIAGNRRAATVVAARDRDCPSRRVLVATWPAPPTG